ncbi:MAG: asparagine synthase (glutamine-hydrolyzing) [Pseudomonadota bacterium]
MCGIAGIYQTEGAVASDLLTEMAARLRHRGPDHVGVHQEGRLGLAHTRLSIIDLAGGHQPLFARDGRLVLIANGEIYNHVELRADLEARGHRFGTHSDCETILHAYAEYGLEFLQHLGGMFAFALYDADEEQLILARDRLGMKPLFIAERVRDVVFASELKALLPTFEATPSISPYALAQYLQNQNSTGRETIFAGIERLLPGEAAVVKNGRITQRWHYWSALQVRPRELDYQEACTEFDRLMETVMREHMRADVPFGLFLSGGVDSTTLLGLLSRYKDEPIRTFSVGFPGSSVGDELSTAEELARHFGSRHTVLKPDGQSMLQRLAYCVWSADDLMRDFANLPTSLLAEEAGAELKVVFSGEGGDEAFAGYGRYRTGRLERLFKNLVQPGSGGFRVGGNFRAGLARQLFGPALRQTKDRWREPIVQAWGETPCAWSDLQRMQYVDLTTALPDNLLVKADRMLMAWSLEGRLPFVDHRVVEFALALPDHLKIEGKQGKMFLKRWASQLVPGDHLWRKKRGFKVPVGEWLQGDYLQRVGQALQRNPALAQWFQPQGVQALIARQQKQGDVTKNVFALLQFALWHRLFIEGNGAAPPAQIDPLELLA